jgi:phage terminase large subunit-like protein
MPEVDLLDGLQNSAAGASREAQAAMAQWVAEREALVKKNPLQYGLPPHSGQLKVHRSTSQEVLLIAANRWGKSTAGMREVLWRATGTHPYKRTRPHSVIWVGFKDYGFYNKTTKRVFDEWCPQDLLIQFHESEKWATFRRKDGGTCTIYFLSYESGRESWQGGKVDFCWLDEELPQDVYTEASTRLIDSGGDMLLTFTPVSGLGWAYDEIYLPALSGVRDTHIVQGALAEKDDSKPYGIGEILVPHMTYEKVLRFARIIKDPDERDIRIFGLFRGRSGGVYKMFDSATHVIPAFKIPRYFEAWGGVDPGYHGFAATLMAMDPTGRLYVTGEYFSQKENHTARAKDLWELILSIYPLEDDDYFVFYCDTANPQDILELNIWAQKAKARMVFTSLDQGLKAIAAGIQRVQEYLTPAPNRATPTVVDRPRPKDGEPMLYFFETLKSSWQTEEVGHETSRLIWEIQRFLWARKRKGTQKDGADESTAGGAHALASLRYAVMSRVGAPAEPEAGASLTEAERHVEELERRLLKQNE